MTLLAERKKEGGLKERKAYIILVLISVGLSLAVAVFGLRAIKANDQKFCDVINATISTAVPKPADPLKDPSRERLYEFYLKFRTLDERLGCS